PAAKPVHATASAAHTGRSLSARRADQIQAAAQSAAPPLAPRPHARSVITMTAVTAIAAGRKSGRHAVDQRRRRRGAPPRPLRLIGLVKATRNGHQGNGNWLCCTIASSSSWPTTVPYAFTASQENQIGPEQGFIVEANVPWCVPSTRCCVR